MADLCTPLSNRSSRQKRVRQQGYRGFEQYNQQGQLSGICRILQSGAEEYKIILNHTWNTYRN